MQIFTVVVNRDDTVRVVAAQVIKETPQFYTITPPAATDWRDNARYAFGYSTRIAKSESHTSPRAALEHYMAKRQRVKEDSKAVIAQATKQIASANEALMHLPVEAPQAEDAVDPAAAGTGNPSTRD